MPNKIAFLVATRKFWPTNSGKEITLYHVCKGLYEHYGYKVYVYCLDNDNGSGIKKPNFIEEVRFSGKISSKNKVANICVYSLLGPKWPLQTSLYYSKSIKDEVLAYYSEISPDVLLIDMIRLAPYVLPFADKVSKKILIMDDDLAKRYRTQLKEITSSTNILGMYKKNVSGIFGKFIQAKWLQKAALRFEIPRIEKAEKDYIKYFDYITFISPVEKAEFERRSGTDKGIVLTMGTEMKEESHLFNPITKIPNTLSFVGNFDYAPNVDSLLLIKQKVLGRIKHDVSLRVIGQFPKALSEKLKDSPNIEMCGRIEDLRSAVCSTMIFLAPIAYGTGIKTKIIEAMGMGMPVVTNSVGAEGIAAQNGCEFFVTDDYIEMAQIVDKLLDDSMLCKQIGINAQKFILKNHTWEKVYEAFRQMDL